MKKKIQVKKKRSFQKIVGTLLKPRLSVFRSNKHIYAQLINDKEGHTLAFSSSLDKNLANLEESTATCKAAFVVGQNIAKKAKEQNISQIIFDRGNKIYHGRIKSLAEGAREEGLKF